MLLAVTALAGSPLTLVDPIERLDQPVAAQQASLTPAQLFQLAEEAVQKGDLELAKTAYRALAENADIEIRTEARFRLAMLIADRDKNYSDAAVLLRQILDEKPDAARVRIELARMQLLLGNLRSAEREFRAAQAGGLPPDVERLVRFYAQQLSAEKPIGFNFEVAIAPDSNINRATNSETLGTIIGDFTLSEDAQANSGVGLALRGQASAKQRLGEGADLLVRASASGDFYRTNEFDDYSVVVQAGPQYRLGRDRINFSALAGWRWFGRQPFSFTYGANAEYIHPLGKRAQVRLNGAITHRDDRLNANRSAENFALTVGYDRAISQRFGVGLRLQAQRDAARDAGFSTALGGVQALAFREFGQTTAVVNVGYSRLEADQRLQLFPERRVDNRYAASLAGTFRALRVGRFAPIVRLNYERNQSTVEINDFSRFAAEFGVTAAF
ncbi:surface lipoprotein assembly modifier [Erythrobacter crassostreae]|uniref:DUF560 domain-containing protein n=1 Tax=Erythrobacter crassostreae TaxID=2828328 RepID=A0A9X1F4W7_9SPHN|nr:surface lipoprotein assembly modifier [Erythrobacter crassostrea]MBV7260295.1 DUF560 domain-containing protein [Erythrobacter crassostrea]